MSNFFTRLSNLLLGALVLSAAPVQAAFTPISLTGFNTDVVANGSGTAAASTSADFDGGTVPNSFVLNAANYVNPTGATPLVGLPNSGLINSVTTSGLPFQLASYTANNSLKLSGVGTGTLTFATPTTAGELYFLAASGNGASTVTVTVTFTDATTQVFTAQSVGDWFGGTGFAIQGIGRVNRTSDVIENNATDPRLYQIRLALAATNYTKQIQSVNFNKTSATGTLNVMAITINGVCSGAPTGGTAVSNVASVCASTGFTVSLNGATSDVGITYQWQSSTNGGTTFTDISGATGATYAVTGQSVNTQYRARLTCSGLTSTSAAVTVTTATPTYTTLPLTESFEGSWINGCNTSDIPNNSWRNTPATGNTSWRRNDDGASAAWTSPTLGVYTPGGSQGTYSARFHSYYAGAAGTGTMDLYANLSPAGAKRLSFDYLNTAGNDSLLVQLSTDGGVTFSRLASFGISGTVAQGWQTQVLNISSTSATAVIRFRGKVTATFTSDIGLDNVVLESATGCLTPAQLTVGTVTATTASVSWLTGNAGTYSVIYGPTGFNPALPASGTNVYTVNAGIAAPPYTITGLTPSTTYQYYVVQNCTGGTNSAIAGPVSFTTACVTPLYASLPFVESFENTWINRCDTREVPGNNWRNTPLTGNNSWRREDDAAAANWTLPTSYLYSPVASQGAHSARFHSGYSTAGLIGTMDLYANLSPAGAKRLSFDYINTSGTDSLTIDLSNDGGVTFSRLGRYALSATFATQVLPISSTSATAVIRFRARADYGSTDIGLDNIILESATGCLTPAQLTASSITTTAASLSWLTGGTGTYTVLYGPTGFNPAQPASTTNVYTTASGITAPPYALTGLTPGTTYQFYVTLNCAGGTNSGTAGPGTFNTQIVNDEPCGATVLTINNVCTPISTTNLGATTTNATTYGYANPGTCAGSNASPLDVWFRFTTAATGPTASAVRITVTGGPASVLRAFSGTACTGPLTSIGCSGTATNTAAPNLDLTGLTASTTYYVRVSNYVASSTLGNFTICAVPVPNCPAPTGLAAANVTGTSADLSWVAGSTGGTYTVIYGTTGFNPATGGTSVTNLTGTTTTLTNLTPVNTYQFYVQQVCGGFNGSSTLTGPISFTTPLPVPGNDEPCAATGLGTATVSGTNVGATTSVGNNVALTGLPTCSGANQPKDVWYYLTPTATSTTLTFTGTAVGSVRLFTMSGTCPTATLAQVACQSATGANVGMTTATFSNLTVGTRYYIAIAGYASGDAAGTFTAGGTNLAAVLSNRAQAETNALVVFPNPSNTGQLSLRLSATTAGSATLLNALGQVVLTKNLTAGTAEHALSTRGLAAGVYTLRVQQGSNLLTRKVVLE